MIRLRYSRSEQGATIGVQWFRFGVSAALVAVVLAIGAAPVAAAAALTLAPEAGERGGAFDASYVFSPTPGSACPSNRTVAFWWDANGPANGNPPGAELLDVAPLQTAGCMARAALAVPLATACGVHTVYAFIDAGRGSPVAGTTASAEFMVTGCASPTPASTATPQPPPSASLPASPAPSVATATATATAIPSAGPTLTVGPLPTAGAAGSGAAPSFPPLGGIPNFSPPVEAPLSLAGLLALLAAAAGAIGIGQILGRRLKATGRSPGAQAGVKWGTLGLALILTFGAGAAAAQTTGSLLNLNVPNAQSPTIQAALDAAPAGANIHIKPGTYHETLVVRKQLQIYGSEAGIGVTLAGPLLQVVQPVNEAVGILTYEDAGGGWLQHVRFEGGPAGVVGLGGDPGAVLEINDVEVIGSGIGIVWDSEATLTVRNTSILDSTSAEFVNLKGLSAFDEFGVSFDGGIGIYIANADVHISNVDIGTVGIPNNTSVGIYVRESSLKVDDGLIYGNNVAGIWAVASTLSLDSASLWGTHADPQDDKFGDGVAVLLGFAELKGIQSVGNARCGVSSFGATIEVADNAFLDNLFHVCGESLSPSDLAPGLPAEQADFEYVDLGGNYCGSGEDEVVCQVTSPGLEPPEPVPPTQ